MLSRFVAVAVVIVPAMLVAQELTLPRKELDDVIKASKDAGVQELTAEHKAIQKAIAAGGKGYGDNRRDAIIKARQKLPEVEAALADAKKASPVPELDVDKLAVGQIGKLYRNQATRSPMVVPNPGVPGGVSRFTQTVVSKVPVAAEVVQIMDAGGVLVECGDKLFWLRMTSAGITTGQSLPLDKPVKVVGTKSYFSAAGQTTVFELAFFAP